MLEHLLNAKEADFIPAARATPEDELDAKYATSLLDDLGVPPDDVVTAAAQSDVARQTFMAMVSGQTDEDKKLALANLKVPAAVKEVVGMLTAYDWAFVEQAKELRGYTVAKITEETAHPDARIRLKALELLGKVTEVALFTERVEVKKVGMSDAELDTELKKRLEKYKELIAPAEKDVTPVEEAS